MPSYFGGIIVMVPPGEHLLPFCFTTQLPTNYVLFSFFLRFEHFLTVLSFYKGLPRISPLSFSASYRSNSLGAEVSANATAVSGGFWGCDRAEKGVARNQKTLIHEWKFPLQFLV